MSKHIKVFLFIIISIFIGLGAIACAGSKAKETDNKNSANANISQSGNVDVTTAAAISRDLPTYFEATGNLAGDEATDVAPLVGGKIVQVNFDIGSYVQKGQVLVRLDDGDARIRVEQAQKQYQQSLASVEQAKSAVRQAETTVRQAEANVRQNQARLGLKEGSNFDIETFSQVRSTKAQLDLAEKELKRFERLLETGDVSKSGYDQRLATRNQLRAQLDEARATAAVAVAAIRSSQEGIGTAQASVRSAQANVNTLESAANTAKVQIEQAQKAVNDAVVYAPISGYISDKVADTGEYISPSAPNAKIATITRTGILRMRIDIPEQSIAEIRLGQSVSLNVSSYPDRNFSGTIARVIPNVNTTSRTLTAEAEIENSSNLLKPGQFATVRVLLPKSESAVLIPAKAVRQDSASSRVFVIKNGRAEQRLVQLGDTEGEMIQIKNGITADEKVATSNLELLTDGIAVNQ